MGIRHARIVCTGTKPLLLHNVQLASPLNPYAKELKALNSKRVKTDEDRLAVARVEFEGSLYFEDGIGPYIPGQNVLASLIEGAKITRSGRKVERGVTIESFQCPLIYEGPRTVEGLWGNGESRFVDLRPVTVQSSKVDRCRPYFPQWAIEATLFVDESALDWDDFLSIAKMAGAMAGLGDYRRVYGRYSAEVTEL